MRTAHFRIPILGGILLILAANPVMAQDPPPQGPQRQRPAPANLVFDREVFVYPQYQRRNPFSPLISGDAAGPRFEGLQLLGVIYSTDPAKSVALFGPRVGQAAPETATTYRVRRGDQLGNIRILQIQETRVVVEIEEFGMREQRIMEMQRPGQGGLS
jgi:hypothetical protein